MLLALLHMQVDVCYLRQGRRRQYNGMAAFRTNIIAFPQELHEMKHFLRYWTTLGPDDLVNVSLDDVDGASGVEELYRGRVLGLQAGGFDVQFQNGEVCFVPFERTRSRAKLPWRPSDLRDVLIILLRCNGKKEEYIEDLRVRKQL